MSYLFVCICVRNEHIRTVHVRVFKIIYLLLVFRFNFFLKIQIFRIFAAYRDKSHEKLGH